MTTIKTLLASAALTAALSGAVFGAAPAFAADEYNVSTGTTVGGAGVIMLLLAVPMKRLMSGIK